MIASCLWFSVAAAVVLALTAGCAGSSDRHGAAAPVKVTTAPLTRMYEFHGHLGPYVVLGYRAGELARRVLESPGYFDLEAEVVCPLATPKSCFIDGIQIGAGCTVGKRNLTFEAGEPIACTFRSQSGKAIRVSLTEGLPGEIASWIASDGVEAAAQKVLAARDEDLFATER